MKLKRQRRSCFPELVRCCSYLDLDLPDDCWERVFRFLHEGGDEEDDNRRCYLKSLSLVSKHFLSITNRHKFILRITHPTLPFLPRLFPRFTNLTSLDFSHFYCDLNNLLTQISYLKFNNFTSLNLSNQSTIPAIGLRAFSSSYSSTITTLTCSNIGFINTIHDLKLIADCFPFLEQLDLSNPSNFQVMEEEEEEELLSVVAALFKLLRKVNLSRHYYVNDQFIFQLFTNCKFLKEAILIDCYRITNHCIASALRLRPDLNSLSHSPSLKSIAQPMFVTSHFIDSLASLKALTCLDLSCWRISDHFLSSIAMQSLPLTSLGLGYCTGYTFSGILLFLSKCLRIQHLDLQDTDFLTDHHVAELSLFLPDLVSINLSYCSLLSYSAFFALVRNCPSLSEVNLRFACIGNKVMASIDNFNSSRDSLVAYPQFKSLGLSNNFRLQDENLILFASIFPSLQLLNLKRCSCITDQCVAQLLKRCHKIRHLNLTNCKSFKSLQIDFEVPNLEVLDLTHTRVDDDTLYVISKTCRGLLKLSLQLCTNVTEKGVMHVVKNCTKLREINLDDCSGVHANVVASMVFLSPSLRKIAAPPDFPTTDRNRKLFSRHGCLLEL